MKGKKGWLMMGNYNSNFIRNLIVDDLQQGRVASLVTRFPPEPNGYLHIGHAKSICLNFGLAHEFKGRTHLRFDDTNPLKEDEAYVEAIKEDVKWLGFNWDSVYFASDYFERMYERAVFLIQKNKAYVDDLSAEQIRTLRGTLTEPGQNSPYRNRSAAENLDLFTRMRKGEFQDGEKVLRAKIDMLSPNIHLRDPVIYRIAHATHHHTGKIWCIYPMYAFAHPLEDAFEGVTHSLCTVEFEDQRPLYNWVIAECETVNIPQQYEFGRLNLSNTVMSKRKLKLLVDQRLVDGWDDPRMPTIAGLRRRGFTPEAIRAFCCEIGVTKASGVIDFKYFEYFLREDLKRKAPRTMGVLKPLKVIITNYPEGKIEWLDADINADNPEAGKRRIPFSREIYIEQDDFMEHPPNKYFRLFPGNEVRLKHAYFITCHHVVKDEQGMVREIHCTYDPETKSGSGFTGRKVKGTLHWVEGSHALPAQFRLYQPLILDEGDVEEETSSFLERVNPESLIVQQGLIEPNMEAVKPYDKFQFFRHGYFSVDPHDTQCEMPVFNLTVPLKSSFSLPKESFIFQSAN